MVLHENKRDGKRGWKWWGLGRFPGEGLHPEKARERLLLKPIGHGISWILTPHPRWVSTPWIFSDSAAINVMKNPFLLTNMLHCSEIPHLGYKERHGCIFFNFVEVYNKLLHLVTTAFWCFFFFGISVMCCIVHSSRCVCTWQKQMGFGSLSCAAFCIQADMGAVGKSSSLAFCLQAKLHAVRTSFCIPFSQEFFGARMSKDIVFNSFEAPPANPHSSIQALLMQSWFLELVEHVGNARNIGIASGKGLESVIRKTCTYFYENFKLSLNLQQFFSYSFSILPVLWWIRDGGPHL